MDRKRRTEILIKGSPALASRLAQEILAAYEVLTVEEANSGVVMVKVRESARESLFYLGEVLITECKVMVDGYLGLGMVKGYEEDLAYKLAIIDAAYNAGLAETKQWAELLLQEESRFRREKAVFKNGILKTRVNFETMDEQINGGEA